MMCTPCTYLIMVSTRALGRVWFFFFSSRRRHTRFDCDWSSDVCSSDLRNASSASDCDSVSKRYRRFCALSALCFGGMTQHKSLARPLISSVMCSQSSEDRKSVGEGKSVDLGGRRIIKKKKKKDDRQVRS